MKKNCLQLFTTIINTTEEKMKQIAGILFWAKVTADGKSVVSDLNGDVIPLAKGFESKPNSEERFWLMEQRHWMFFKKQVAVPFEKVGYAPVGQ